MAVSLTLSSFINILRSGSDNNKLSAIKSFGSLQDESNADYQQIQEVVKLVSEFGFVIPVSVGNEKELCEDDFVGVNEKAEIVLEFIHSVLLDRYIQILKKDDLLPVIVLCCQYIELSYWSKRRCVKSSDDVLKRIFSQWKTNNLFYYLVENEEDSSLLNKLFKALVSSLTSSNWKSNPAMKIAFQWCLFQIKHPFCADILNVALPASLLFVDDYIVENRVSGIRCLHHILNTTPVGDLQRYGCAELIYSALKNVIYHKDPKVITVIYPCMLKVLSLTEENPLKKAAIRHVNKYDFLLNHLLKEMNMEETTAIRSALSSHLITFIDIMGITVVRHLKTTLDVLLQYLEVYDGLQETTRSNCLNCLEKLITVAQPRIEGYLLIIVKGIVRLLYEVSDSPAQENVKAKIRQQCIKCLKLLHDYFPSQINEMCKPLVTIINEIPSLDIVNKIWTVDNE